MRQWFFFALLVVLPATLLIALLYSFFKYLYTVWEDRRELKELDAIQAACAARRAQDRLENATRLDNGCQHAFDTGIGFPPGVCPKCGLEAQRPSGVCDHIWRRVETPTATSQCEKCGKTYRAEF
jgi:hypothetical protein